MPDVPSAVSGAPPVTAPSLLDVVCSVCRTAKPAICFDHALAHRGEARDVCQPCLRDKRAGLYRRRRAKMSDAQKRKEKELSKMRPGYASRVAEALVNGWGGR